MEGKFIIGDLIHDEIARQKISVPMFAAMIYYSPKHIYKVLKNNNIGLEVLTCICKVLNRNFFVDLAQNFDADVMQKQSILMESEIPFSSGNISKKWDLHGEFLEFLPDILRKLGKKDEIYFSEGKTDEDYIPDFMLNDYPITFTIGNRLSERLGKNIYIDIETLKGDDGLEVELVLLKNSGSKVINVPINADTSQWQRLMLFAFECVDKNNCKIVKIFS